ncbi:XkdX family protein [Anoxybacillus rupiensis]|uniref:XkdX family protein n=1 Tax=Anoxybacteroides rupiense TaxID=311460 RepID=A0ABD5IRR2_9BACL|nr:XkdX family protein [Anoxybacillus rupiensis]
MPLDYFSLVKRYYTAGYYTDNEVKIFVQNGKISEQQYQEITGEPYVM